MGKNPEIVRSKLTVWLDKRGVWVFLGLLSLVLSYVTLRWAFDRGSLLDYATTLLLFIFGVRELVVAALNRHGHWKHQQKQEPKDQ